MPRERPIVEPVSPSTRRPAQMRGIISPCTGCKNNIPVNEGGVELEGVESISGPVCPKRVLYELKKRYGQTDHTTTNWNGPVYDDKLRGVNPVWPNANDHGNAYAYVFVATFEDNVETGFNPTFDTERIVCRGPYLIKGTEREWHILGHIEQQDAIMVTNRRFFIEGQDFMGLAEEAQVWQVARGYAREIDRNLTKSNSANGSI